jgi:hypothetical protein
LLERLFVEERRRLKIIPSPSYRTHSEPSNGGGTRYGPYHHGMSHT